VFLIKIITYSKKLFDLLFDILLKKASKVITGVLFVYVFSFMYSTVKYDNLLTFEEVIEFLTKAATLVGFIVLIDDRIPRETPKSN